MLELTAIASFLRGLGFLYWALAIGLLAIALLKGKGLKGKTLWAVPLIGIFGYWPTTAYLEQQKREAFAKEAWSYYRSLCDTKAGEKIYKTFTGVKSVLVVKPLPPATDNDLSNQFWYGDPYSDATPWDQRGTHAAGLFTYPNAPIAAGTLGRGFDFVEVKSPSKAVPHDFVRVFSDLDKKDYVVEPLHSPTSRFSVEWEDISTPEDRKLWIAGSRLRILDMNDKSVVAERVGYLIEAGFGSRAGARKPWLTGRGEATTCPAAHDWSDRWFVLKVLDPTEGKQHSK